MDAMQPNKSADNINIQQVAICDGFALFYVSRKFIYIMEKGKFTGFNKATLAPTEINHKLFEIGDICQIVGKTDTYTQPDMN